MNEILKYFPNLTATQIEQFVQLQDLYEDWNSKINVISRKDIGNLYLHHVLHSLTIAKIVPFKAQSKIADVGTGGGFPGIPLAIMFPEAHFDLIDSVGKKLNVVSDIAEKLHLENVSVIHSRMEDIKDRKYDFFVSRATLKLQDLVKVCKNKTNKEQHNCLPNGLICLKGGDLKDEIKLFKRISTIYDINEFFSEDYFKTKKVVYIPLCL